MPNKQGDDFPGQTQPAAAAPKLRFAHSYGKSHQFGQTFLHLSAGRFIPAKSGHFGFKALPNQQELNETFGMS